MQRKQRPFYYASEEQFRWLQIIASKIKPDANLNDVDELRAIANSLGGRNVVKREETVKGFGDSERVGNNSDTPVNLDQEEGMEGVVDGIGTLVIDNLGRQRIYSRDFSLQQDTSANPPPSFSTEKYGSTSNLKPPVE